MSKHLDIRFLFDEEEEDDYVNLELTSISVLNTDLTDKQRSYLAEQWAQSDHYWIETAGGIIAVLDGDEYDPRA